MWRRLSILGNYKARIVIFVTALLVWLHAVTEKQYEHVFQAKVVPINIPEDYLVLNNYTQKVGVQFRGTGKFLLRALINTKIEIRVDVGVFEKSPINVKLRLEDLDYPGSKIDFVPIKFIDKDTINFYIEPIQAKEVRVNPQVIIQPAPGYTIVGGIQIHPEELLIVGPKSFVDEIDFISSAVSNLENEIIDVSGEVELINPYPRDLLMKTKKIDFVADIQQLGEKSFADVSIKILNAPNGIHASVLPSTLSLKIKGGVEIIDSLHRKDILAYVDFTQYKGSGESLLSPLIRLPNELSYFDVFPEKIELKLD